MSLANYFKSDINKFIPHEVQIVISIKNLYHKITLPTIVSMGYININIRREWVIGSEGHVLPLNFVYLECQCDNCKRFFDKLSKLGAVSDISLFLYQLQDWKNIQETKDETIAICIKGIKNIKFDSFNKSSSFLS